MYQVIIAGVAFLGLSACSTAVSPPETPLNLSFATGPAITDPSGCVLVKNGNKAVFACKPGTVLTFAKDGVKKQ